MTPKTGGGQCVNTQLVLSLRSSMGAAVDQMEIKREKSNVCLPRVCAPFRDRDFSFSVIRIHSSVRFHIALGDKELLRVVGLLFFSE